MVHRCDFQIYLEDFRRIPMGYPPVLLVILIQVTIFSLMLINFLGSPLLLRRAVKCTSDKSTSATYLNYLICFGLAIAIAIDACVTYMI